jgi:hypothetical protein
MSCEIAAGTSHAHRNPNFSFAADLSRLRRSRVPNLA